MLPVTPSVTPVYEYNDQMNRKTIHYEKPVRLYRPHTFPEYIDEVTGIFRREGHEIYMIGGCVRDLLLDSEPNDYDFCVSADAEEMIRMCREYGLDYNDEHKDIDYIVVYYGDKKIDINTFQGGSVRSDMLVRDFTINALTYDNESQEIIDYSGGIEDIRDGVIRLNNPERLAEEPEIILRALRFSIKLGFRIDEESYRTMQDNVGSFESVRTAFLIEYMDKLLRDGRDFFVDGELVNDAQK